MIEEYVIITFFRYFFSFKLHIFLIKYNFIQVKIIINDEKIYRYLT